MTKPRPNFDYERASRALAVAALEGDAVAAQREGITERSVRNYRARMEKDATLSALFHQKKVALENNWANEIAPTLRAALAFIRKAAENLDPKDPEAVHAIAGAFKLVNEGHQTMKVIDARLAELRGPADQVAGQVATQANTARAIN